MKVGITGATGFIGRNLVKSLLLKNDVDVSVLCKENKVDFPSSVKVYHGDLVEGSGLEEFTRDLDVLIHLAARIIPPESEIVHENILGTFNLVRAAKKSAIRHIIFTSSIAVYGNDYGKIATENSEARPNTLYGLSKLQCEEIIKFWSTTTGNKYTILRPFNMYGPGNLKGIIFDFYKSFKKNGKFTIYGTGSQSRDFLYVFDVIDLLKHITMKLPEGIFNVGSGYVYTINDIAKVFEKVIGQKINKDYNPSESGKVFNIEYSIEKLKNELNWKATHNLEDGLRKTIKWYEENIDINSL